MIDTRRLARESVFARHQWDSAVSWLREDAEELMPEVVRLASTFGWNPLSAAVHLVAAKEAHGG